jgi:phage shock protein PspC (stress-responsive transcriptional regulator)
MPSLVRFIVLLSTLIGIVVGALYAMATLYEPPQGEVVKSVHGVSIRKQ